MSPPLEPLFRHSEIFSRLDDEGRARLARVAVEQTVAAGQVVLQEGDPGDAFYFVVEGALTVDADSFDEPGRHVANLEAGTVFGEIASLTREPRTATITAATDARLLRFEMVSVFGVLKDYPDALADLKRLGLKRS
jgi:CRP-like cAMP-binding protein